MAVLAQDLKDKTGKNVNVSVMGHSLGGALASNFHARLVIAMATRSHNKKGILKAINSSDYDEDIKEAMKSVVNLRYPQFYAKYYSLNSLNAIKTTNLLTKYSAKGLKEDDILAMSAICALKEKDSDYDCKRYIMKHTDDWVSQAGEQSALVNCIQNQ